MKQRFVLFALLIAVMQVKSFAQGPALRLSSLPLTSEEGIYEISISDNIDLVLIQESPENVRVSASDNVIGKLMLSIDNGRLTLAAMKNLVPGERLAVYVFTNELQRLTLSGNAFATSVGILQNKDLHISAGNEARISIKSSGRVWFDSPENYVVVKEKGYSLVYDSGMHDK